MILVLFSPKIIFHEIRQKLQNIIRGNDLEGQEDHCTAIRNLLSPNSTVKREFESRAILKEEQARFLKPIQKIVVFGSGTGAVQKKLLIFGVTNAKRYDRIVWKQGYRKNMEW